MGASGCRIERIVERLAHHGHDSVQGSGVAKTDSREVGTFHQIALEGAADLTVKVGPEPSVSITADDNLIPLITTSVENGELTISTKESTSTQLGIKVAITVPSLDKVEIRGAGDVHVEGVHGPRFMASIQGAGDLKVLGKVDESAADIAGAGDIDFTGLIAKNSSISIAGSGDVKTYATGTLKAAIRGSGEIGYLGHPKSVEPNILGSGDINPLD